MTVQPIFIKPRDPSISGHCGTVEGPMLRTISGRGSLDSLIIFRSGCLGYFISYRNSKWARQYPSGESIPQNAIVIRWNGEQTRGHVTYPRSWNEYWFHQRDFGQVDNQSVPTYAHLQGQPIKNEDEDDNDF